MVPKCKKGNAGAGKSIIIIGGGKWCIELGAGGVVVAESLRQNGFQGKVTVVSREPYLPIDR